MIDTKGKNRGPAKITKYRILALLAWATGSTSRSISQYYKRKGWDIEDPHALLDYMRFFLKKPGNRE